MMGKITLRGTLFCIALLAVGCSSPTDPADQSAAAAPGPQPEQAQTEAAPPAPPPAPPPEAPAAEIGESPAAPAAPAPLPTPMPVAPDKPAPTAAAPAAPAPTPAPAAAPDKAIVDAGGPVEVPATKPGLSRVGSDKCAMCHDLLFESWSATAHAARKPPLDCESCHGPGSGYKTTAIMKDPAKARAAGLVIPDLAFCSQCHVKGVTDELLKRVHPHNE